MTDARILQPLTTEFTLELRGYPLSFRVQASHPPLDLLDDNARLTVVTGPRRSGRSTLLATLLERRGGLLLTADLDVFPGHPLHRPLPRDTVTVTASRAGLHLRERVYISPAQLAGETLPARTRLALLEVLRSAQPHVLIEPEITTHLLRDPDLFVALRERLTRAAVTLCTGPLDADTLRLTETISRDTHYLSLQARHPEVLTGQRQTLNLSLNGEALRFSGQRDGAPDARFEIVTGPSELDLMLLTCAQHERTGGLLITSHLGDVSRRSRLHAPDSFDTHEHVEATREVADLTVTLSAALRTGHANVYLNVPLALLALTNPATLEVLRFGGAQVFLPVSSPGQHHTAEFIGALRGQYGMPTIQTLHNTTRIMI